MRSYLMLLVLLLPACLGTVQEAPPEAEAPSTQAPAPPHPPQPVAQEDHEIWGGPEPEQPPDIDRIHQIRDGFRSAYLRVPPRADALVFGRVVEKRFEVQERRIRGRTKRAPMTVARIEIERTVRSQVHVPDAVELTFEEGSHSLMVQIGETYFIALRETETGFEPVLDRDYSAVPLAHLKAILELSADRIAQEWSLAFLRERP